MSYARFFILTLILSVALIACSSEDTPEPTSTPEPTVAPTAEPQAASDPVRILRLDSYHTEFPWTAEITRGALEGLSENGFVADGENVIFDEYFMDTKRNTSEEYFEQISADTIAYIEETQPDVVIASDDNAARLVVQPMRNSGIPFVILGLNGTPEQYEFDATASVTAVLERPHTDEMIVWIGQVIGENARISILAEDSPTSERMFSDNVVQNAIDESPLEFVEITYTNDYEDWQEFVNNAPQTSDVLFLGAYATLRNDADEAIEPVEALRWAVANSEIPVMGFWEEAVHDGTLGGAIISGNVQGHEAGVRAAMILNGTPASEIPHSAPPRGKLIINRAAMEKWNVEVPLELLEVSEIIE
ncbi:MAG TPA: ABC transporter substrate binding protein [Aggregatilineales bacterium]|nr:ABC transporter substrate binding protein [Aggregatilineales bacterium]